MFVGGHIKDATSIKLIWFLVSLNLWKTRQIALLFREKNTIVAKAWLDKHCSDSAPGKSKVENWFAKFKWGEMNIEDDAHSRRPKELLQTKTSKKSTK